MLIVGLNALFGKCVGSLGGSGLEGEGQYREYHHVARSAKLVHLSAMSSYCLN